MEVPPGTPVALPPGVVRHGGPEIASPGVDFGRLRQVIHLREGDIYTEESADAAVAALYALGEFRKIILEPISMGNGVRLVFHLQVRPQIHAIPLQGNLGLSEETIRGVFQAKVGGIMVPYELKADLEALRAKFLDSGYLYADVRQETRTVEGGVDVIYHVEAGPKLNLESIRFEGNADVPESELLPELAPLQGGSLFSRGKYDPALLRSGLLAVREVFRRRGWLDATVGHEFLYDMSKERAYLVVRVLEGSLYRVSRLTIRGAHVIPVGELYDAIKMREGEPFSQDQLEKDLDTIRALYGNIGYIKAEVGVERVYSENQPVAALTLTVREGEKYYVNKVIIRGNLKTQDHVIRREVVLLPGQVANTAGLAETKRRLENLGYFTFREPGEKGEPIHVRFVDALPDEATESGQPDETDVLIEVTEGSMGNVTVGAGFSSDLGLIGNVKLTHNNFDPTNFPRSFSDLFSGKAFTGDGQRLVISLSPGTIVNDYRLSWLNPSINDSPYSIGFDVYLHDLALQDFYYNERRYGTSFTVGRRFFRDLNITLTPRWEMVRVYDLATDSPADAVAARGWHNSRSLTLAADYDRRDNPFFTTSGYRLGGSVEMAGTVLGGGVNDIHETLEARKWWTVWDAPGWGKHILNIGGQIGFVQSTEPDQVPIYDRLWIGGLGSLRGFEYRQVGPVDPITRQPIGGEYSFLLNGEYEVPIVKDFVRGLVFVDSGSLAQSFGGLGEVRVSTGVGLRLRLPIMGLQRFPISLYLGAPIVSKSTDTEEVFSFTVGTGFEF